MVSSVGPQPGWGKFRRQGPVNGGHVPAKTGQFGTRKTPPSRSFLWFSRFALPHRDTYIGGKSWTMVLKVDHGLFAKCEGMPSISLAKIKDTSIAHPDCPVRQSAKRSCQPTRPGNWKPQIRAARKSIS